MYKVKVMSKGNMFLAMVLTNAKREEARAVRFSVEGELSSIDVQLLDGSRRSMSAPPPEILLAIMQSLAAGQDHFESNVFSVTIESITVKRGASSMMVEVDKWSIGHV